MKISTSISPERIALYESHGFVIHHNHRMNVNPLGDEVMVDFSATDPAMLVQVAVKMAYEAGQRAGEQALQGKLRALLGIDHSN